MAGLIVTLCIPVGLEVDLPNAIRSAMAPFEMYQDENIECGMWDSWRVAGGDEGIGFAVLPGFGDDEKLLYDDILGDGARRLRIPGVCAGGPRGILDLSGDRLVHERTTGAAWDFWQAVSSSHGPIEPLARYLAKYEAGDFDDLSEAISSYLSQDSIRQLMEMPFGREYGSMSISNPQEHPIVGFKGSREEYIQTYSADWPIISDVLTVDGWWLEADGNQIHGNCDSIGECMHVPSSAGRTPSEYLHKLPGDVTIVRLKCHS